MPFLSGWCFLIGHVMHSAARGCLLLLQCGCGPTIPTKYCRATAPPKSDGSRKLSAVLPGQRQQDTPRTPTTPTLPSTTTTPSPHLVDVDVDNVAQLAQRGGRERRKLGEVEDLQVGPQGIRVRHVRLVETVLDSHLQQQRNRLIKTNTESTRA